MLFPYVLAHGRERGPGVVHPDSSPLAGPVGKVGYGFDSPQGPGGVVTPYTGLGLSGNGSRSWRMGARWQVAGDRSVSLKGARHEATKDDGAEHDLMLRGAVRW